LEENVEMVTVNFFVIVLISLLCFSVGQMSGRIEASVLYSNRLHEILTAMKKVSEIASLRGEDLTKLSTEEIVTRTKKHLELKDENS
jgi:hypothetical protein